MRFSTVIAVFFKQFTIWFWRFFRFSSNKLLPYKVTVQLTNKCNSRCSFCDIWKIIRQSPQSAKDEITLADLEAVFLDLGDNLIWLALSGGEVTLVPYFKDMIRVAKKHCGKLRIVSFTTNGLLPDTALKLATFVKQQNLDIFVNISLDGDEKLHDALRGIPGNYASCWHTYNLLQNHGINCHFGLTVSDQNIDFINSQYANLKEKIKAVTFVHSGGIMSKDNTVNDAMIIKGLKKIYSLYVINGLSEIIEKIHLKISILFLQKGRKTNIIPCEVLNSSIHILPHGEITPCMFLPSLGNIKEDQISKVYNGQFANQLRQEIEKDSCPHCWLNCYSPHSIMLHPWLSLKYLLFETITD